MPEIVMRRYERFSALLTTAPCGRLGKLLGDGTKARAHKPRPPTTALSTARTSRTAIERNFVIVRWMERSLDPVIAPASTTVTRTGAVRWSRELDESRSHRRRALLMTVHHDIPYRDEQSGSRLSCRE